MSITDEDMIELKKKVLKQQYRYLVDTLGDPSRYMPYMIADDILDINHKEIIRSKVTSKEKAGEFIDMLMKSPEGASAFDVFVEALLEERVQSHIARKLQQALKVEKESANLPPAAQPNAIDEELISSVASYSLTDSCHSVNEEVTPCQDSVMDAGPKPPPPPTGSLIKTNSLKSHEDLYPPYIPTAEVNLSSYNTHPVDHLHMQESYASELDSLRKENEELKTALSKSRAIVERLQLENRRLLTENSGILLGNTRFDSQNGMPIPEQSTSIGFRKQSEMVPKGSGTY